MDMNSENITNIILNISRQENIPKPSSYHSLQIPIILGLVYLIFKQKRLRETFPVPNEGAIISLGGNDSESTSEAMKGSTIGRHCFVLFCQSNSPKGKSSTNKVFTLIINLFLDLSQIFKPVSLLPAKRPWITISVRVLLITFLSSSLLFLCEGLKVRLYYLSVYVYDDEQLLLQCCLVFFQGSYAGYLYTFALKSKVHLTSREGAFLSSLFWVR